MIVNSFYFANYIALLLKYIKLATIIASFIFESVNPYYNF